jgi:ribose transport system substrate-binding protein
MPFFIVVIVAGAVLAGDGPKGLAQPASNGDDVAATGTVRLAVVAKAQNNLVFQAAYRGALHAAATLADDYGVTVEILWESPRIEDAQAQADRFRRLIDGNDPPDGVAISVISPEVMTPLIDQAVAAGIPVVTFDGDAPDSDRMAYYGEDNVALGRTTTRLLCEEMGSRGVVAVMIANVLGQNAQDRLAGMREALEAYPEIELWDGGLVKHEESFHAGRARMREVQLNHPEIRGWVLLSAFPLFGEDGLDWMAELPPDERPRIAAVDALPPQLPYLERGQVDALVAQDCFGWGVESVRLLLDRVVRERLPASDRVKAEIDVLDAPVDAERWRRQWDRWLRRRPGQ